MQDSKKGLQKKNDPKGEAQFNKKREENPKRKNNPQSENILNFKTIIHTFSKNSKYYKAKNKRK